MLSINFADVVKVLQLCAPYLIALGVVIAVGLVAIIACCKLPKSKKYLVRTQSGIALALAVVLILNLVCFGPMSTLISLAMSGGSISEATNAEAQALCEEIADEGIVLLDNDGGLPLANTKLNVFGWASTNPIYGGTGSGAVSGTYPVVSLLDGLHNAGIETNQALTDFYTDYRADRPVIGMWEQDWTLPEPPAATYGEELIADAKAFSDTALVVISRAGGEGADVPSAMGPEWYYFENNSEEYDDFAEYPEWETFQHIQSLSQSERDMIDLVTANFENVVVVYNGANTFELGFTLEYPQIKSVVWCPGTGQTGFNSLGKILTGEVNPSGKTVDTFTYDLFAGPWNSNFGWLEYDNMNEEFGYAWPDDPTGTKYGPVFVNYVEGIYVGYKYYETVAADGLIPYEEMVLYPFGHGLSYTTFSQEMGAITEKDGVLSVEVIVTNTGDVAGKDTVQLYYNPPYYNGGIEKAAANLAAFDKTDLLQPGESQKMTLQLKVEDMASYDYLGEGAWVLEEGEYKISIRKNSHDIIAQQSYFVDETVVYGEGNARSTDDAAAVNRFDQAAGDVVYLSRADGFANYWESTAWPTNFSLSEEYKAQYKNNTNYVPEDYNDPNDVAPALGARNGVKLVDMRGKDYDDPAWDKLLDQLTPADMNTMISLGGYQTAPVKSVGKIQTVDCDGPASINNNFTGKGSIAFPNGVMVSATWNEDLAKAFGESIGKMADEMGVSGWYAPAMNIHRSPFGGRNFEYYSEDGFLSGKIAANAVLGAKEYGVYAYLKHFALNDQEDGRDCQQMIWCNEQAMREIYLKPFEICVKEGGAQAMMSSFNLIGLEWAGGCDALLNKVLRDEWGFRGMVLTDYFQDGGYMDAERGIRNGNDICLAPYDSVVNNVHDQTSATSLLAMRQACKNIMYTTVNSRAYAPENYSEGPQGWQIAIYLVDAVIVAGLLAIELTAVRKGYAKRKKAEEAAKNEA